MVRWIVSAPLNTGVTMETSGHSDNEARPILHSCWIGIQAVSQEQKQIKLPECVVTLPEQRITHINGTETPFLKKRTRLVKAQTGSFDQIEIVRLNNE